MVPNTDIFEAVLFENIVYLTRIQTVSTHVEVWRTEYQASVDNNMYS